MSIANQVKMIGALNTAAPTDDLIQYAMIHKMVDLGFTLYAIRELFERKEVVPKPHVYDLYHRAVIRIDPFGGTSTDYDHKELTPVLIFWGIVRDYLISQRGLMTMTSCNASGFRVLPARGIIEIRLNRVMALIAGFAAQEARTIPTRREIVNDFKRLFLAGHPLVVRMGFYQNVFTFNLDWLVHHRYFPKEFSRHKSKRV